MKFRVLLLMILTISIAGSCLAQKFILFPTYNVDSLLLILPAQQAEERVNTINNLAVSLSYVNSDSAKQYVDEAMKLAAQLNYKTGMANAFLYSGHTYRYQGKYVKALSEYLKAIKLYKKLGMKRQVASLYQQISIIHYLVSNFEMSLEYGFIAFDKYKEHKPDGTPVGNVADIMSIKSGAALIYFLQGECKESLEITLDYLKIGKKSNFNKTDLYLHLIVAGERFRCTGDIDSAKKYFRKAISTPSENTSMEALKYRAITSLGYIYLHEDNFDKMILHYQQANDFYNKRGFLYMALNTSAFMGYTYYQYKQAAIAEIYFKQAEKLFDEIVRRDSWHRHDSLKNITSWGLEIYFPLPPQKTKELAWKTAQWMYYWLYKINKESGKFETALNYHILYTNSQDTLNKISKLEELVKLQLQYETQNYEEEIGILSQETAFQELKLRQSKYFLFGMASLVIFVLILAIVLVRQNRLREQQKNLLLQQRLFRSQMNPHFLFNSLSSIHNFMLSEKPVTAASYLSRFSKLVRAILNSSVEEYISLTEEIGTIENYLELQKVRFPEMFDYTIEVDEVINPEITNIPSMLTQPFIENSIEHGIKHKNSKGNISVRFKMIDEIIIIEIEDNGIGREKAKELLPKPQTGYKSLSTSITQERIQVLNRSLKKKIKLNILDLKDSSGEPSGTKIILQIPFN